MRSYDRRLSPARLIAIGRTSEVYRLDDEVAAKVLNPGVPREWADLEASFTDAVRRIGVAAPEVHEVTTIDGRPTIMFGHVDGPSLWSRMCDEPDNTEQLVGILAEVQQAIHAAGVPDGLPSLVSRLRLKLDASSELTASERAAARELLAALPQGAALLHGDLHPGNVLLGQAGPVVIDWFDATVGHPHADVARTSLLLQSSGATDLRHLPGATPKLTAEVERCYTEQCMAAGETAAEHHGWTRLMAASRLSERTDADTSGLLELWRRS